MKIKATIAALALLVLASCGNVTENTRTVKIDGRYRLDVPASFEQADNLNEDASLQYQNLYKPMYAIVIDEPKSVLEEALDANEIYDQYTMDLKGYSELITEDMRSRLELDALPPMQDLKINGLNARLLSFEGMSEGYQIYWKVAFIEGHKTYYQVMVWTLASEREEFEEEMNNIVKSFKETDKSKY